MVRGIKIFLSDHEGKVQALSLRGRTRELDVN